MADRLLEWVSSPVGIVAALFLVVLLVALNSKEQPQNATRRDPRRVFSVSEREQGHARAGHRCELDMLPFVRCRNSSNAGDHWFPYSKGGATSMSNFVAACAFHNGLKSNHLPTKAATARIEARRRRYFPPGVPRDAGQWLP